jgi:hypothetical protein
LLNGYRNQTLDLTQPDKNNLENDLLSQKSSSEMNIKYQNHRINKKAKTNNSIKVMIH